MPNARAILKRRNTAQSTRKITRTMELVASAKLQKAQRAAAGARPFAEAVAGLISRVAAARETSRVHPLLARRPVKTAVIVVVTSDRGLCGAFNTNLVRDALTRAEALRRDGATVRLVAIGRKGAAVLRFMDQKVDHEHRGLLERPDYQAIKAVVDPLIADYAAGHIDLVEVVFSRFFSVAVQKTTRIELLPCGTGTPAQPAAEAKGGPHALYLFEPDADSFFDQALPPAVRTALFAAVLQTAAGEQAARRLAMKNATDAAGDLIENLTRDYNRVRQGKITQEIAEIVGAVEAMS